MPSYFEKVAMDSHGDAGCMVTSLRQIKSPDHRQSLQSNARTAVNSDQETIKTNPIKNTSHDIPKTSSAIGELSHPTDSSSSISSHSKKSDAKESGGANRHPVDQDNRKKRADRNIIHNPTSPLHDAQSDPIINRTLLQNASAHETDNSNRIKGQNRPGYPINGDLGSQQHSAAKEKNCISTKSEPLGFKAAKENCSANQNHVEWPLEPTNYKGAGFRSDPKIEDQVNQADTQLDVGNSINKMKQSANYKVDKEYPSDNQTHKERPLEQTDERRDSLFKKLMSDVVPYSEKKYRTEHENQQVNGSDGALENNQSLNYKTDQEKHSENIIQTEVPEESRNDQEAYPFQDSSFQNERWPKHNSHDPLVHIGQIDIIIEAPLNETSQNATRSIGVNQVLNASTSFLRRL